MEIIQITSVLINNLPKESIIGLGYWNNNQILEVALIRKIQNLDKPITSFKALQGIRINIALKYFNRILTRNYNVVSKDVNICY